MTPPISLTLATPIEPDRSALRAVASAAPPAIDRVYADPFRRLDVAVASSCGRQHDANEDAHSELGSSGRLFVVADGVGGGAMARLASRLLVAQLHEALDAACRQPVAAAPLADCAATAVTRAEPPLDAIRVGTAVLRADRTIAAAIAETTDLPGAATVVLAAPLDAAAARWLVAWVGDCRCGRWSPGSRFERLTRDDTFANLGERPPPGGSADDPARMVGNGATAGANAAVHALGAGEILALCSDGVHKHLDDDDWCRLLAEPLPLGRRSEKLVALARAHGSVDDATVLLIERSAPPRRASRDEPARDERIMR